MCRTLRFKWVKSCVFKRQYIGFHLFIILFCNAHTHSNSHSHLTAGDVQSTCTRQNSDDSARSHREPATCLLYTHTIRVMQSVFTRAQVAQHKSVFHFVRVCLFFFSLSNFFRSFFRLSIFPSTSRSYYYYNFIRQVHLNVLYRVQKSYTRYHLFKHRYIFVHILRCDGVRTRSADRPPIRTRDFRWS